VCESLQFERRPATDCIWASEQCLQGYNNSLPAEALLAGIFLQLRDRMTVYAPHHLIQPSTRNVLLPQRPGIPVTFEPGSIDDQPVGKRTLQRV
jgi:hypothetical protein